MPELPFRFGFYAILTDPLRGYEYCTRVLVDAGVAFVQLRMKDRSPDDILPVAEMMRNLTSGSATKFIVNDFPEIALKCGADGVHIGQDDMPIETVRQILGPEAIIGLSTHSPEQTQTACALAPDYIGIGPVFPTPTKKNPDPVIGINGMKAMLSVATVPAVVIGGIDFTNVQQVLDTGAPNFCMVRQFTQSEKPEETIAEILKLSSSNAG